MNVNFVTIDNVIASINDSKPYTSPGFDSIYPIMIQKASDIIAPILKLL